MRGPGPGEEKTPKEGWLEWVEAVLREGRVPAAVVEEVRRILERPLAELARASWAVKAAGVGVWRFDRESGKSEWDEHARALLGLPAEVEPSLARFLDAIHPEDRAGVRNTVSRALDSLRSWQHEFRVVWPDGSVHWLYAKGRVQAGASGEPVSLSGILLDIDAGKEAEARIERARGAAEAATLAKSHFLASMSHEIRTPMHGVLGMAEVLAGMPLSAKQRECVDTILVSGKLLLGVVNDILDFSAIESGRLELERVSFDLRALVETTVEILAEPAHRKGLELACLVEADVPGRVEGDPGRLRQVLVNLVGNAVKFTETGEVVVRARMKGDRVHFEVRDTGPGIPVGEQPRLFSSLAGLNPPDRKSGGAGLGLVISGRLVEAMGGRIGLRSLPTRGTTLWFEVPLAAEPAPPPRQFPQVAALVVDGNPTARRFLAAKLRRQGVRVRQVLSGEDALAHARRAAERGRPFTVAFLDRQAPEGPRAVLAAGLREVSTPKSLAVVYLTTFVERAGAEEAGICSLMKPVQEAELARCLERVVAGPEGAPPAFALSPPPAPVARRVLLVEDDPASRQVGVALLEVLGCRVDTAEDGLRAIEAALAGSYDLILMDWWMPELDGLEATREIRRVELARRSPRTRIVAMTAQSLPGDREKCLEAGMDDYLSKPLTLEDLSRVVGEGPEPQRLAPGALPEVEARLDEMLEHLPPEMVWGFVQTFCRQVPEELGALRDAANRGDAEALTSAAHRFRGACYHFGTPRMVELAGDVVARGRAGALEPAAALLSELEDEARRLTAHLEAERARRGIAGSGGGPRE